MISISDRSRISCNIPPDMTNEILKLERLCLMYDHLNLFKKELKGIENDEVYTLVDQYWQEQELARYQQTNWSTIHTNYHFEKLS